MNYEKLKTIILQSIALVAINIMAFIFDGQYIPMAIGIDALVLGFNIRDMIPMKESK